MNSRIRLLVAMVVMLTGVLAALVWNLNLRHQSETSEQVQLQAEKRSMQLSDAMAAQMDGYFSSVDLALNNLRREWLHGDSSGFAQLVQETLSRLPRGFVSHAVIANRDGRVLFDSLGLGKGLNIADRDYFRAQRTGRDRLVVGVPVRSRLDGRWVIAVSRPMLRDGRFAGTVHLTVPTAALAGQLAGVELSSDDIVVLVHGGGEILARSVDNDTAMGQQAPPDRPFLSKPDQDAGVYHRAGTVDQLPRMFGWHRMQATDAVMVVGISDRSLFEPLKEVMQRSQRFAGALALLLVSGGGMMSLLLWRAARSQQAASESEQRLKEAQSLARVGNWEFDFVRYQFTCSDEVYRILGQDQDAGAMTVEAFLNHLHPDDRKAVAQRFQDVQPSDTPEGMSFRVVMPDGGIKHVRGVWVNAFEGGRMVYSRGTLQDIEEVHAAQVALMQLNEKLEQRVEERTRELGAVNRELEAFAYSVSHDLRTPLRSIHGFASLIADEWKSPPGEVALFLERIQQAAKRMGTLITDLLSMAHHSRAPLQHQRVDLSEMAWSLVDEIQREDPGRPVEWDIEDGLQVQADPTLMRVVVQNLLTNAWKYSKHASPARIGFLRTGHADGGQEFCVRDNGAGFDMAFSEQLFQPFKRLHTNQEFEGTGVGLATVQRVIQRHGGTVRGESRPGQGAAFFFTLPDNPVRLRVQEHSIDAESGR